MTTEILKRPPAPVSRLEGRHVLWSLLAFFGVIFAVNGYFLFAALSTHSGVVAIEPYRKGLAYNDRIAAGEQQTARGWRDTLDLTRTGRLEWIVWDQGGAEVPGLQVAATIARPSTARQDRKIELSEQSSGRHGADVGQLQEGTWIVSIEARKPGSPDPIFRSRRRLWLKP
jgi:nitrogen fixation protein FixH